MTPEQVWDSARQNELDSAIEEGRSNDSIMTSYLAAQKIEFYAELFGVDTQSCIDYGRSVCSEFDGVRNKNL